MRFFFRRKGLPPAFPDSSLDGRSLGTCPGPVTKRVIDAFDAFTRSGGTPFL